MGRRPKTDIERFVDAQEGIGMHTSGYAAAYAEICAGRKTSHWIWYVFPQLRGLGRSDYADYYGIADAGEARAYLDHPILGARLCACCEALLALPSRDPHAIFGKPDDMKVKSCMTLFAVASHDPLFVQVLDEFYGGAQDGRTLGLLRD